MEAIEEAVRRARPGVFTVTRFFADGAIEVRANLPVEEAVRIMLGESDNPSGGLVRLTISDDCKSLVKEWRNPR